jgi:hypothetical protein
VALGASLQGSLGGRVEAARAGLVLAQRLRHLLTIGVRRAYPARIAHWRNLAGPGAISECAMPQMPGLAAGASPE